MRPFIIAIDGRCCAGKTTFAARLAGLLGAEVLHIDDFCLPIGQCTARRSRAAAGHVDIERLRDQVLRPAALGQAATYKAYDCQTAKYKRARKIMPGRLIIVEGCYSLHPKLAPYYGLKIFMTIGKAQQKKRLIKRNGPDGYKVFAKKWIPAEERYFKQFKPQNKADVKFKELT